MAGAREKLEAELAKLKGAIAEAEAEEVGEAEDELDDPEELAADVAKKASEAAKRTRKNEIAGVSEATMQAFLEEARKITKLLEGGKIGADKAKGLLGGIFDLFGGDEE